jgi:hypothetical protein
MTTPIPCEIFAHSDSTHLQQLYTGFSALHKKGIIQLIQTTLKRDTIDKAAPPHLRDAKRSHLKVLLDRHYVLYYDTHDSFEIDASILATVDVYFKRSYLEDAIRQLELKHRVFPLGLNYPVYSDGVDVFAIERAALHKGYGKFRVLMRSMGIDYLVGPIRSTARVNRLESYPAFTLPAKVLFMTQVWDPKEAGSRDKADERESLNDMRANCVLLLKKEFGEKFLGGLSHDDYSRHRWANCLLPDHRLANKSNYLKLLTEFPICVTTTGLHGSMGWKLGEYVSQSKAIVTEPLKYSVPGRFDAESNYLEFSTPEGCVECVTKLFTDYQLRCRLMMNNFRYYHSYVRPDSLVLNTLALAITSFDEKGAGRQSDRIR